MIRGLYTAATGMNAQQHQIDVSSNNIANVNTHGFKKDRAEFQDLMYDSLNYTSGRTSETTLNPTGIDVGMGVRLSGIQKSFMPGSFKTTGNKLDIAIEGNGFFKVTTPEGELAYTKSGSFKLNNEGAIVNGNGYKLDPEIVIPKNLTKLTISKDGIVSGTNPTTGALVNLGQISISDFINPAGLSPIGETMFKVSEASGPAIDGNPATGPFGGLRQAMIETSNVSLVNEMVDLITAQRAYEANSKSISTADEMLDIVNRLKR